MECVFLYSPYIRLALITSFQTVDVSTIQSWHVPSRGQGPNELLKEL